MAFIEASDGVELYVERHPRGRSGGGLPILFSCAYSTTRANWYPQAASLAEAGYRVGLWDYRGHGLSSAPDAAEAYTMSQVVSDLGRIVDWLAPGEACVLAGLSFGGLASLHYAFAHPERVAGLVLAGTGPGFKNAEAAAEWRRRSEKTADYIESRGLEEFVSGKAGATCVGRKPELPAAQRAADAIRAQNARGLAQFGRHVTGSAPSVIDELQHIDAPALVVVGEEDLGFLRAAEVMAAKLPRCQYERIAGAGHIVNIEAADVFNRLLTGFLAGIPIPAPAPPDSPGG
jgi:pimeloyl-ACP methyl ester carboxylesterase